MQGCAAQARYAWEVSADGRVRIPHQVLVDLVGGVLDDLAVAAGPIWPDVVAGGVSCFLHSVAGLDASGRPITPVLSWADTTSADEAAALRLRVDPAAVHALTGAPIHASYWPARILGLRREAVAIRRWAGFPELLLGTLTGRPAVSGAMASGTGLLDRAGGSWAASLANELDVEISDLPELVADDQPIGRLTGAAARRWPALAKLDWFAAWGDGACGNLGLGAAGPGRAALMIGTSGALRAVVAAPAPAVPEGLFAYRLGAGAVVGGQLSEGGGLLAWAGRLLGRSAATLERDAAALEPDGHGLTVLPYAFGERGLGYHDAARGALAGLTPGTDAAAVYRAFVESIAYSFAAVDERLSGVLGGPPALFVSGGSLAHSPLLGRVLVDALGRDISVAPAVEASRRGAAILALRGSGLLGAMEAVPALAMRMVRHDPDRSARYAVARARRADLYEAVLG